jgi:hypothetical protein
VLARLDGALHHAGLLQDGQDHVDGGDVVAREQVVERLALDRGAVEVDGDRDRVLGEGREDLGGFLGARVDGFERQRGVGLYRGEVFCE